MHRAGFPERSALEYAEHHHALRAAKRCGRCATGPGLGRRGRASRTPWTVEEEIYFFTNAIPIDRRSIVHRVRDEVSHGPTKIRKIADRSRCLATATVRGVSVSISDGSTRRHAGPRVPCLALCVRTVSMHTRRILPLSKHNACCNFGSAVARQECD